MDDIHSCSYYCEYPACIKRQRDEMREKLFNRKWQGLTQKEALECKDWQDIEAKLREKNT
jgi:hypothetical protein